MPNVRVLSADLGNGFTKVVTATMRNSFPSVISVEDEIARDFEARGLVGDRDFIIEYRDKRWAIGQTVWTHGLLPVTIAHRTRIQQEYYKVLFAASLAMAFQISTTVHAIVSLPPAAYWDREAQREALAGEYQVRFGDKSRTYTYTVPHDRLRVLPEGFGTAALFCLERDGQVRDSWLFGSRVGVVDVGTYSTDYVMLDNMKLVRRGTDSLPHALHDIHTKLRTYVSSQGVDLDAYEADDVLRAGYFLKGGQHLVITDQKEAWAAELAQAITAHLRTLWSGGDAVEHILVTGGGAPYVAAPIEREFSHARHFESDPEYPVEPWEANCEGAYRYALFLDALEQKKK
jgi:hypothetical protein